MLMLSKLTLQHDWKKAAGKKSSPRRRPPVLRYDGRWPFIGSTGNAPENVLLDTPKIGVHRRDTEVRVGKSSTPGTAAEDAALGQYDSLLASIRRSPLQAMATAAGVGFVLASIAR